MQTPWTPGRLEGAGTPFDWPEAIGFGRQPFAAFPAGPAACTAGPNGVALDLFGWIDPLSYEVSNTLIAGGYLGFVLPVFNPRNWQRVYPAVPAGCCPTPPNFSGYPTPPAVSVAPFPLSILRAGAECVVAMAGDFLTRFAQGAIAGSRVWVDPASGLAYTANLTGGGYVASAWTVMQNNPACNARVRISSFAEAFTHLT